MNTITKAPIPPAVKPNTASPSQSTAATSTKVTPSPAKAEATLDLTSLEQRLRDTRAIGVFTKLSLKNQVDDLLNKFRSYHQGQRPPLTELHEHYDLLLMKVVTVIQDGDPTLASAISSSKSAIWDILADREKFQKI